MKRITTGRRIFALLMSALLFCLIGCQPQTPQTGEGTKQMTEYENQHETPKSGGILRLALTGATTLNPLLAENQNNLYVLKLIYDGLFRTAPDHSLEPVLCDSYSVSPDGLTYSFQIREGISFHNGQRLTAADAEASLSLLMGANGVYSGRLDCVASHKSQGMTLTVTLRRPTVNFPALMDFPIVSKADIGTRADLYIPNGTGRYKVQSYKQSKELYLSVNQNYFEDFAPYIPDVLIYQLKDAETAVSMLENMQLNLLPSAVVNLYEYTPERQLSSTEIASGRFTFLGINNQRPALLSGLTRTALSLSVDREALLSDCTIAYATPADMPLPPNSALSSAQGEGTPYDPERARQLLLDDGWQDIDDDGTPEKDVYGEETELSLNILVNEENHTRLKIAARLQEYFREVGIPSVVTAVSFSEYERRIARRDYDVFVGGVSLSDNFDLSFLLKTDENSCGISNERIDQLLNALPLREGEAQKQALFYELCEIFRTETPLAGLYFEHELLIFDNQLKGDITPAAGDIFYGIENWFFSSR